MKVLVLLNPAPGLTAEKVGPVLPAETRHAWALYKSDTIREIYFRGDTQGAALILECKDREEAESIAASLPLVQAGHAHVQTIPLLPFGGWAHLGG